MTGSADPAQVILLPVNYPADARNRQKTSS